MAKVLMLTTAELIALARIGSDRLAQLEGQRVIKRAGRDRWPALQTLGALIGYYRSDARRAAKSQAESEYRDAKTNEVTLRVAQKMHELIRTDDAAQAIELVIGRVATLLLSLPARIG